MLEALAALPYDHGRGAEHDCNPSGLPASQPTLELVVGWMRMMGATSVRYHAETVFERGDDHRGSALEYYGSRGETPLCWGGSGAAGLGLEGRVTAAQYEAIYGAGGATDPQS